MKGNVISGIGVRYHPCTLQVIVATGDSLGGADADRPGRRDPGPIADCSIQKVWGRPIAIYPRRGKSKPEWPRNGRESSDDGVIADDDC
jgi:hypothetical protein